jgi:uncharacterized hydrophobic protein (TIGR00271 family)
MKKEATPLISLLKKYFNIHPDKDDEKTILENVESSIDFQGAQLRILIFAIFIASLGLNVNSTAVIIGAMLISPLMGPIIGMGLAVGISDISLLRRSATNFLVATVISVITATIYFAITPLDEAQSELLARTSPSLYDVLIALLGGAAGFIALTTKGKGNVIPGVAIATALMPPLCTAGYGLAVGNLSLLPGGFLPVFHQHRVYRPCHIGGNPDAEVQTDHPTRCRQHEKGETLYRGHRGAHHATRLIHDMAHHQTEHRTTTTSGNLCVQNWRSRARRYCQTPLTRTTRCSTSWP